MPTDEQLNDYFARSGDKELSDGKLEEDEHGFCVWRTYEDSFILVHVYGDGQYWDDFATEKARELGMKKVIFGTLRNPELFIRRSKYDYKIACFLLERAV